MTVLDKARLRQTIYELAENEESNNQDKNAQLDQLVTNFLNGSTEISYDYKQNKLLWQLCHLP